MNIYIIEDDHWYSKVMEHYLSLNPEYRVKTFNTGKNILNELKNKPDVICMDYTLPDIKGEKLLIEIKFAFLSK